MFAETAFAGLAGLYVGPILWIGIKHGNYLRAFAALFVPLMISGMVGSMLEALKSIVPLPGWLIGMIILTTLICTYIAMLRYASQKPGGPSKPDKGVTHENSSEENIISYRP